MTDEKIFDRTSLKAGHEGYMVHRDYAAHFFRWGWAVGRASEVGLAAKRVLDVGCGTDLPLLTTAMYVDMQPAYYVGVDLNPLRELTPSEAKRARLHGRTDFTEHETQQRLLAEHGRFDVAMSFEVIEHMPVEHGWKLLWGLRQLVKPDGYVLLSTPVCDGHRAANHVHEYTLDELRTLIDAAGFDVAARYGTFASVRDVKPAMRAWAEERGFDSAVFETLWNELRAFHSPDVLATFVAPVIPDAARNNAWKLVPR